MGARPCLGPSVRPPPGSAVSRLMPRNEDARPRRPRCVFTAAGGEVHPRGQEAAGHGFSRQERHPRPITGPLAGGTVGWVPLRCRGRHPQLGSGGLGLRKEAGAMATTHSRERLPVGGAGGALRVERCPGSLVSKAVTLTHLRAADLGFVVCKFRSKEPAPAPRPPPPLEASSAQGPSAAVGTGHSVTTWIS